MKSCAANATGSLPTVNEVCGTFADVGIGVKKLPACPAPGEFAALDKLPESRESVMGKRSPTKKVAGLLSCARINTCLPLCTRLSASEKSAATPGRVNRNRV